jgi:peptidoglycan/xylan/chitin deacetylase (PgdA/CDA1 family)
MNDPISRRSFLRRTTIGGAALAGGLAIASPNETSEKKALVAISLDLEMARNFPAWQDTHWDYEKGNLNEATKRYAVEAARRVKKAGGVIHFFLVASALEQEDVSWLKDILAMGHSIGNHTYDHIYLLARTPEEIQFKFKRAPWLIRGKTIPQVVRENIQLANAAITERLGIQASGFRTPGGFANGLDGREDLQKMLLELGFKWGSGKYPSHPNSEPPGTPPTEAILEGIVRAQSAAQPYRYPTGLIEIPMAPISDVGAFRNGRWDLEAFLEATRRNLDWCMSHRAVFDFLAHPAVLSAKDPDFRTLDLICSMVTKAPEQARLVSLETIAQQVGH